MVTAYAFWALTTASSAGRWALRRCSLLVCLVLAGRITELGSFRPLRTASPLAKLVASLGLLLFLQAAMLLAFGSGDQIEPSILPKTTVTIFNARSPTIASS